jgi:hypothetical protein
MMTIAEFNVTTPNILASVATSTPVLTQFYKDRVGEVRSTLAAAGWTLASGTPGAPAYVETADLPEQDPSASPFSSSSGGGKFCNSDFYSFGDGQPGFVRVLYYLHRGSTSSGTTRASFGLQVAFQTSASIGPNGLSSAVVGSTNPGYTNSPDHHHGAYTIKACRRDGYLALFTGGPRSGTPSQAWGESFYVAERVCDAQGVILTGDQAGLVMFQREPSSVFSDIENAEGKLASGVLRLVDGQAQYTQPNSNGYVGVGPFAGPHLAGGPAATPTTVYDGNTALFGVRTFTTVPAYARRVAAIQNANITPGTHVLPHQVGGGSANFLRDVRGGTAWGLSKTLALVVRYE